MKEYNANGYIIRIAENALIQMCLNGLETYSIAHKRENAFRSISKLLDYVNYRTQIKKVNHLLMVNTCKQGVIQNVV